MEKLDQTCPHCNGQGYIQAPEWEEWWKENKFLPPPDHPLRQVPEENPCSCYGLGVVPTPFGLQILLFVSRYLGGHESILERYG